MAHNFLVQLQEIDQTNNYVVICSPHNYIPATITNPNFKVLSPPKLFLPTILVKAINKLWRVSMYYYLSRKRSNVFYSFHNMRLPRQRVAKRMIASNLDLIPIVLDEYKGLGGITPEKQIQIYKDVTAKADKLVSISEFSKQQLSEILDVPISKIDVVHLAPDQQFELQNTPGRIVKDDYIFTIGGSEPRKNVKTVIEAYEQLPDDIQQQYKLVIAGGKWHGQKLDYAANENIIEIGYVPDEDLPGLYANSSVFVFASVYEGFGFTILEAMATGTPVINAKGSSLDEVAGDATLSFQATDSAALAAELEKVLNSQKLRADLTEKGYSQLQKFSWKESAIKLHQILTDN